MDTFSTSVSTLKISSLPPPPSSTNHFTRTTPHVISPRPIPHFSSTSKPNSSIATQKTKPFFHNNNNPSPSLPIIRRVVEQGNFQRHVVVLVKMLMKKNKLEIVEQVLEEFVRIYDELCGTTQVVLVSSKREIGKDEMFGIAKSVHKLNGAVRVRVRNLVQQSFPSFAM
jgi:hypothetical protein